MGRAWHARATSWGSTWGRPTARWRTWTRRGGSGPRPTSGSSRSRNWSPPARRPRGRCSPRSSTCPGRTSSPRAPRSCPGTRAPTGSSASSPASRGRACPATSSPAPRAGSAIPGSIARPTSSPGRARRGRARSRPSRPRPTSCATSATPGITTFAREDPSTGSSDQEVVLTVPASFDEAARELTLEAAKRAGLASITLLEEPQAAFYCWIVSHQEGWQREVRGGELILVCDIGGGTTDFSLITVVETPTGPGFRRVAVGDHLMLGGDNIDLALAHRVEQKLGGARLDAEQWSALRYACRTAKEKLLADSAGRALAGDDRRAGVEDHRRQPAVGADAGGGPGDRPRRLLPRSARDAEPERGSKLGLQEFGLPFVADPAITKHLGAFLRRHKAEAIGQGGHTPHDRPARPDAILFNGGALTPAIVRDRLVEVVTSWFPDDPGPPYAPRVLSNDSLDLAVADGRGVLRGRPPRGRDPDRRRDGAVVLRGLPGGADRPPLALRRPPRRPGRGRDRDRRPRLRPPDGAAGRLPAGEQLGPARRPARRPASPSDPDSIRELPPLAGPDARRPQGEGRARARPPGGAGHRGRDGRALVPVADRRPPLAAADPAPRAGRGPAPPTPVAGDGGRPRRHRAVGARRGRRGGPDGLRRRRTCPRSWARPG